MEQIVKNKNKSAIKTFFIIILFVVSIDFIIFVINKYTQDFPYITTIVTIILVVLACSYILIKYFSKYLYIVENGDSLNSIEDLKGKTIYSTGKGTTPEYVFNYVLKANGIDPSKDVNIEYKSEATEIATLLASEENVIALLPQPFIAASQMKNDNIKMVFSMEEEWQKLNPNESQVTGVVVVRDEFLENNQEAVVAFLEEYKKSVEFVNSNVEQAAKIVGEFDIIPEPVALKAIPLCNVVFITGDEMEEKLGGYLKVLHDSDPKSIGGNLPDEEFYFK